MNHTTQMLPFQLRKLAEQLKEYVQLGQYDKALALQTVDDVLELCRWRDYNFDERRLLFVETWEEPSDASTCMFTTLRRIGATWNSTGGYVVSSTEFDFAIHTLLKAARNKGGGWSIEQEAALLLTEQLESSYS